MPKVIIISFDYFFTKENTQGVAIKSQGQDQESYIKNNITNLAKLKRLLLRAQELGCKIIITLLKFGGMGGHLEGRALVERYLEVILGTALNDLGFIEIFLYPSTQNFSLQHIQALINNYNKTHIDSPINEQNKKDWLAIFDNNLVLLNTLQKEGYSIFHIDDNYGHFSSLEELLQIGKKVQKPTMINHFNKMTAEGKKKKQIMLDELRVIRKAFYNINNIIQKLNFNFEVVTLYNEVIKDILKKYSVYSLEILAEKKQQYLISLKQLSFTFIANYKLDLNQMKKIIDESGYIIKLDSPIIIEQTAQQLAATIAEIVEKYQLWLECVIQQDNYVSVSDQISEYLKQEDQRALTLSEIYQVQCKEYTKNLELLKEKYKQFLIRYKYFIWQFEAQKNRLTEKTETRNYLENNPVYSACLNGNLIELQKLLENDENIAKLKQLNNFGKTPLHLACEKGHYETVKYLLTYYQDELDLDLQKPLGPCAIHLAAENGFIKIVELLLKQGASPSRLGYQSQRTPLFYAIRDQNIELINLLFKYGAEIAIYTTDNKLCSDLHHAVNKPSFFVLKEILRWFKLSPDKVNVDLLNYKNFSAMGEATLFGHRNVVELFYVHGIRLNATEYEEIRKKLSEEPIKYDYLKNILKLYDNGFNNFAKSENSNNQADSSITNNHLSRGKNSESSINDLSHADNRHINLGNNEENISLQVSSSNQVIQTNNNLPSENVINISTNTNQFFAQAKPDVSLNNNNFVDDEDYHNNDLSDSSSEESESSSEEEIEIEDMEQVNLEPANNNFRF